MKYPRVIVEPQAEAIIRKLYDEVMDDIRKECPDGLFAIWEVPNVKMIDGAVHELGRPNYNFVVVDKLHIDENTDVIFRLKEMEIVLRPEESLMKKTSLIISAADDRTITVNGSGEPGAD